MYKLYPSLLLGFHGCEQNLAESIFAGKKELTPSQNEYDWLGHGVYFWENSPDRALQFAKDIGITKPAVVGAVIHPMRCFDLLDSHSLSLLKEAYQQWEKLFTRTQLIPREMPENSGRSSSGDILLRKRDCAVIEYLHSSLRRLDEPAYDTLRGVFWEGKELYPGAGFKEKDHIQICVRSANCIKGYFRPLKKSRHSTYPELVNPR